MSGINTFITLWKRFRLKKVDKQLYYRSPDLICTNCLKQFEGYILKENLVSSLICPNCKCDTVTQSKKLAGVK